MDVERGIEMFDSVQVPCVAVVENMAFIDMTREINIVTPSEPTLDYDALKQGFKQVLLQEKGFTNDNSQVETILSQLIHQVQAAASHLSMRDSHSPSLGQPFRIFGPGHKQRLSNQWGIEHTFSVPLLSTIAYNGDSGTPFVLQHPSMPESLIYKDLASAVVREIAKIQYVSGNLTKPTILFQEDTNLLQVSMPDDKKNGVFSGSVSPADLRRQCKCASCVEELSGRQILQPWSIPESVKPRKVNPTGNYAWSIDWSDGHKSLYPYRQIRSILQLQQQATPSEQQRSPLAAVVK